MVVQSFCTCTGVAMFFFLISQKEDIFIWHLIADAFEILKKVCPPEASSLSLSSCTQNGFCSEPPVASFGTAG